MHKRYSILAIAALLGALSCQTREERGPERVTFQAVQADALLTKTVLQADGAVYWSPGDAINLYYGASASARLNADNREAAAQTSFSGSMDGFLPNGRDDFWAVYPYAAGNTFNGSAVSVSLPDVQTAVAGSFAPNAFISMARSKDYTLQFYNLCGGIQFSLTKPGIKTVIFRGNNEETLAGTVQASFDQNGRPQVSQPLSPVTELRLEASENGFEVGSWYYLVSLPASLSAGYSMTFIDMDGEVVAERFSENPVTIKRSVWGILAGADDVIPPITASKYLTFRSEGNTTLRLDNHGDNAPVLYFSTDAQTWTPWDYSSLGIGANAPLYLCGDNLDGLSSSPNRYSSFVATGDRFSVSGDIMSLVNKDEDWQMIPRDYCFYSLFQDCTGLTAAPALSATNLSPYAYGSLFTGCTSLTQAPVLQATSLAEGCYANMFAGAGLTAAPELGATRLEPSCYSGMFASCIGLTAAPELPAATLAESCYARMFYGCSNLAQVKCLATSLNAPNCTADWLGGVAQHGLFIKAADMQGWTVGASGIPEGWSAISDGEVPSGDNEGTEEEDWN